MANSENQVELKINLDVSGVQSALYDMIDQFTGTGKEFDKISKKIEGSFKNLQAAIKVYGETSKEAAAAAKTYERAIMSMVSNGIDPGSQAFQRLKVSATSASNSLSSAGDTLKRNNRVWTNLALVVQDLPFGFRGIQNNLPALISGIAGMTGPIYLLGSAIIALFTYWDNGSSKAEESTNRLTEALKRNNDVVSKGAEAQGKALVEMSKMSVIFTGVKDGTITAKDALEKYNQTYGDTFGIAKSVNEAEAIFVKRTGDYVKASALRAMANEKYAQAQEEFKKGRTAQGKDNVTFLEKMASAMDALDKVGVMGQDPTALFSFFSKFAKNYADVQKQATTDIVNSSASAFDLFMSEAANLEREANKYMTDLGLKNGSDTAKKLEDNYIEVLRALQKLHKDNIFEYANYETQILNRQEKLAVAQAILEKKSGEYIANIQKKFLIERQVVTKELGDKWLKQQEDIYEEQRKIEERINNLVADGRRKISDALLAINQKFLNNDIDAAKKANEVRLKLDKGWIKRQVADYQQYIDKLNEIKAKALEDGTGVDLSRIDTEIQNSQAAIEALGDSFDATAKQISGIVSGMLGDALSTLGENIGKALAGGKFDPFSALLDILANGLSAIGKALIAYGVAMDAFKKAFENPYAAIAAGVALVAVGSFLKSKIASMSDTGSKPGGEGVKAFANGGIISGPTYGLMGEYPGAKTNPEVVAPLDKLKDMIGGGNSGQFVLKGQDLVLAMTRSEKSLKLRRG